MNFNFQKEIFTMKTRIFTAGLPLFVALFLLVGLFSNVNAQGSYSAGDIASDFTLNDMAGNSVSLSDYTGYAVFLNFFAYW
ncbi:redoxin domain-containing protein [bacterium]|nr:redoxin domain-containing protein [bacterium]